MFSYRRESDDVADVRGRSGGAGVDYAVCRDDRGLGTGDSAALRRIGNLIEADPSRLADGLGKSRMAGAEAAFRVDSARPRHHHYGGESARMRGWRSPPPMMQEPVKRP